jgi:outer membrane protein assembly factor BamB
MRTWHRLFPLFISLLALAGPFAVPATAAPPAPPSGPTQAVAYQIGISHDGLSGDSTIAPPLTQRWSRDLSGSISYPLIAEGKVFVTAVATPGGSYGTTLYALDQVTGATLWSQPIAGTYYWSNAAYDAGHVFVVNFNGLMSAFDASTGALSWSTQLPGQYAFSSPPTADSGVVYVGGAGSGGTLYAVRETDGAVLWTQPVMNGDDSSPALSSTAVFVSYACGLVYAFDRVTGQQQWFNGGPCEGGGGKTAVYHANQVYSRDFNGNEIIDAGTGNTVGTFSAQPAPAFSGKTGLFLSGGTLKATSGRRTLWSFAGDGGLDTAPIVVGSTVFVGSSSGMLYGLALSGGTLAWSTNVGAGIPGPDEQNVSQPLTGLGAGQGLLVVPAGSRLVAYGH